jgi:hypothetical protein
MDFWINGENGVRCQEAEGRSQKPEARIQKSGGRESRDEAQRDAGPNWGARLARTLAPPDT